MNKYIAILSTPADTMDEWTKTVSEEERKAQMQKMMQDWQAWADKHKEAIADQGSPLGKTKRVTKDGIADTRNSMNYFMVVLADSHDAAAALFADNPHILTIPNSYVEVMDVPHMGM
jgi:hypothetical protein